jgi:hypothetical protein
VSRDLQEFFIEVPQQMDDVREYTQPRCVYWRNPSREAS